MIFRQTKPDWYKKVAVKRKRFTVEQIVAVLNPAELRMPVSIFIRQLRISEQAYYLLKKQ